MKINTKFITYYSRYILKSSIHPFLLLNEIYFKKSYKQMLSVNVKNLFPAIEKIAVNLPCTFPKSGEISLHEALILGAITSLFKPKRIFEFGTYKGFSTLCFALNSPQDCQILTLDLPSTLRKKTKYKVEIGPLTPLSFEVGERIKKYHKETTSRIKQLYADSADFDYSPYEKNIDLIFIDGNHQYENVKNDSQAAFYMLKKNGIIIWHDYSLLPEHYGVFRYLNELSSSKRIYKIKNTKFVIYKDQ